MHQVVICFAMLMGVAALWSAGKGIAAITRGRLFARAGRHVVRPRVFGWGMLVMAVGVASLAVEMVVLTDPIRWVARLASFGLVFLAERTVRASRHPGVGSVGLDRPQPDRRA
ncbi:hypothetical protein [Streptomyces sp. NPDC058751]|uniref:DUF7144 family membrane protein n=1 Tax=Streptomyces sp. NPDC058751 TaxID=3346623 RepID=UPI0036B90717